MPDTHRAAQPAAAAPAPPPRPPFRADHVGSLLRPRGLLAARDDFAAGRISGAQLRGIEDTAIREAVRQQEAAGLRSATDGEFRRESWHMDFIYQLGGIRQVQDDTIRVAFHNKQRTYQWAPPSAHVVAPLALTHTIFGDAFTFLSAAVTTAVPKLTIPSPSMVHYRGGRSAIDTSVYPDLGQFWADLAAASTTSAAATCNSTTPASPTSTTPPSAPTSPTSAATPTTSTNATSPPSTAPWPAAPPAWPSPPTCAAATTRACGPPKAATTSSPKPCSTSSTSTDSSANGTTNAPAASHPCATSPPANASSSASSPPNTASSKPKTPSNAASTTPHNTSTPPSSASPPNADSPPPKKATTSPPTSNGPNSPSSSKPPKKYGAPSRDLRVGSGGSRW